MASGSNTRSNNRNKTRIPTPERITPLNASRLNGFIRRIGKVDWKEVNAFIDTFELRTLITENLTALSSKQISISGASKITQTAPKPKGTKR